MKKSVRTIMCGVLAIFLLFMNTTALAVQQDTVIVSDGMKSIYDQVFTGNGEVYDADGNDVTVGFVARFSEAYRVKDYESILIACKSEGISKLIGYQCSDAVVNSNANGNRAADRKSYSRQEATLVTNNGQWYPGKTWYIIVIARGSYTVGYAYPNIITVYDISTPTIVVDYSGEGAAFQGTLNSMSVTTPKISSTGTSFSFSVTTKHSMTCPIPGLDYLTGTLGPFTNVTNFTITA